MSNRDMESLEQTAVRFPKRPATPLIDSLKGGGK